MRAGRTIFEVMAEGNADARLRSAGFWPFWPLSLGSSADISNRFWQFGNKFSMAKLMHGT